MRSFSAPQLLVKLLVLLIQFLIKFIVKKWWLKKMTTKVIDLAVKIKNMRTRCCIASNIIIFDFRDFKQ